MSEIMKAVPSGSGGLASAHERIAVLLDELNETVELVDRLTRMGESESALRLVDEQRAALFAAMDQVSHAVAKPPRWREVVRRQATGVVAAAALLFASLAVAVSVLSDRPTLYEQAHARLSEAQQVRDPTVRLQIIERVVEITRAMPAGSREKEIISADVLPALEDLAEGGDADEPPSPTVIARARALADEVQRAQPPSEGEPTPPSTGQPPVEDLNEAGDALTRPLGG